MTLLLLSTLVLGTPDSTCVLCHSELRAKYSISIHTRVGIGCTACHGGTPNTLDMKKAHSGKNFKSRISRKRIPYLCSSCHSDPEVMRVYGIPIDQMAYYLSSQHGKAWKKGDLNVAICTDCHGVHDILPPEDPRSPTNAINIPRTCGKCHSDSTLMKKYGLSPEIPEKYSKSVHFKKLQEGQKSAPNCVTCHSSHGAQPPGVDEIEKVCGSCHMRTAKAFDISVHKKAFDEKGYPECGVCHNYHDVISYETQNLDSVCKKCHSPGSKGYDVAQTMKTMLLNTETLYNQAKSSFDRAKMKGLPVLDLEQHLNDMKTYLYSVYPLVHTSVVDSIEFPLARARSLSNDVLMEIQRLESRHRESTLLITVFWFYVMLTVLAVEAYLRIRGKK